MFANKCVYSTKMKIHDKVETDDGTATIIDIEQNIHTFKRYRLKFDEPDPYFGFCPWYDENEVRPLQELKLF